MNDEIQITPFAVQFVVPPDRGAHLFQGTQYFGGGIQILAKGQNIKDCLEQFNGAFVQAGPVKSSTAHLGVVFLDRGVERLGNVPIFYIQGLSDIDRLSWLRCFEANPNVRLPRRLLT